MTELERLQEMVKTIVNTTGWMLDRVQENSALAEEAVIWNLTGLNTIKEELEGRIAMLEHREK